MLEVWAQILGREANPIVFGAPALLGQFNASNERPSTKRQTTASKALRRLNQLRASALVTAGGQAMQKTASFHCFRTSRKEFLPEIVTYPGCPTFANWS